MDVKLVNLFVNVTDKNGTIVGGLTRDDFAITEDGRPQEISLFERQSELPLEHHFGHRHQRQREKRYEPRRPTRRGDLRMPSCARRTR